LAQTRIAEGKEDDPKVTVGRCRMKKKNPPLLGVLAQRPGGYATLNILQKPHGYNVSRKELLEVQILMPMAVTTRGLSGR
jgi:hypothetical protein